MRERRAYCAVKRALDVLLSLPLIALGLLPVCIACAAVYCSDPGPVLFRQERVGRGGRLFVLYKIRTMRTQTDGRGGERITAVGRVLRRTSLDELPQLWNVLRGDMSLVGPRPLIPQERRIHALREAAGVYVLRPGMTGLAQIHGRDLVGPEEKARWDAAYLRDFGFRQDVRIVLATVKKVLCCEDVAERER